VLEKLNNILVGWKGYIWESPQVEALAKERALQCSNCEFAKVGIVTQFLKDDVKEIEGLYCDRCVGKCPLSTLLRSLEANCKEGKW